jgi:site-specific DNA-methyltransferase (adenine-specific)
MKSSLITDLKILNSSPLEITPVVIIEAAISGHGIVSSASFVASIFSGARAKVVYTLGLSARGAAASTVGGLALRPEFEPIILARKPLVGTVAANVLEHGTGALNIDGCRIAGADFAPKERKGASKLMEARPWNERPLKSGTEGHIIGRWPANLVLDEEAAAMLDEQSGETVSKKAPRGFGLGFHGGNGTDEKGRGHNDTGGASRFFYTAKSSSGERHYAGKNSHPTVKPVDLMRWLVRLVTPPGGVVLDPFMGSGSTGIAALAEGFRFVGCELDAEMVALARRRIFGPLFAGEESGQVTR